MSAQRTLNALTMGFTRLKKFPHLAHKKDCKKQEVLVHVDPACIEWIMEKICVKDFV
jgi:hypothetical protein